VEKASNLWNQLGDYINSFLPVTNKKPHIPPPLPAQYRRPFVLVIDLECLVSSSYVAGGGWKTVKRPGTDYFLSVAKNCFEIIVFSKTINSMIGFQMMQKIDLEGAITYKFFDDYDKDVATLNRPMEKMIIMTTAEGQAEYEGNIGENLVILPEWRNVRNVYEDTTLMDLSIFVSELQNNSKKISDVRSILKTLNNQPKPMLQIYKERGIQQLEQKESMLGSKKGFLK
jgi:import inner membrane translocase subunit TIM50